MSASQFIENEYLTEWILNDWRTKPAKPANKVPFTPEDTPSEKKARSNVNHRKVKKNSVTPRRVITDNIPTDDSSWKKVLPKEGKTASGLGREPQNKQPIDYLSKVGSQNLNLQNYPEAYAMRSAYQKAKVIANGPGLPPKWTR